MPGSMPPKEGIKMSIGFCRENFDLNKNSIVENKKKEYYVFDIFDGETYTSEHPGHFAKYLNESEKFKEGDVVGA